MNVESFFSENTKAALKNNPPGAWMPTLPKECIRLSSGYPAPSLVPTKEIKEAVGRLLDEEKDLPLHYLGSPRIEGLKRILQERLASRGINVAENEILITSGACQAIDLIARILLDRDAIVAVECPTYMEALEIFQNYTSQIISIPIDKDGMQTDVLAAVLADRKNKGLTLPRFLYTIPSFQNPTGTTMIPERRRHLLNLAKEFDFLVLEDDAYGELSFEEISIPLKAMDTEGRVLHISSISKIVAPGMRIGWLAGKKSLIDAAAWFKKDLDHPFSQSTLATYLETVNFEERLKFLKDAYKLKCKTMLKALEKYLPKTVKWFVPEGGYFVWIQISGSDTVELLEKALERGLSFVPGKFFFLEPDAGNEFLRLSFSYANEREIIRGVQKLGEILR